MYSHYDNMYAKAAPPRFSKITEHIYLGSEKGRLHLEEMGIDEVISITDPYPDHPEIKIPETTFYLEDSKWAKIIPVVNACNEIIDRVVSENKRVFVHCRMGISRSPSIVIGWLIHTGMSYKDAFALVHEKRNCIDPNSRFRLDLQEFHRFKNPE